MNRWTLCAVCVALAGCGDQADPADPIVNPAPDQGADMSADMSADLALDLAADLPEDQRAEMAEDQAEDMVADMDAPDQPDMAQPPQSLRARVCAGVTPGASPGPLARPTRVATAGRYMGQERPFGFLEGPVWLDGPGWLVFSDMNSAMPTPALNMDDQGPPTILYRLDAQGAIEALTAEGQHRTNGLAVGEDGWLWAAAHDQREIARIDPMTLTRQTVADRYDGKRFNTTNDLVVDSGGGVYFTDPAYNGQLDGRARELMVEGVFRVSPSGEVGLIDDRMKRPNGITLAPDESALYVASRDDKKIYRFPLTGGQAGPSEDFISGPSVDGVAIDCAGNLYLAWPEQGVEVYGPDGVKIGRLEGTKNVTNLAFGGAAHRTLYITLRQELMAVELAVPGLPY